MPQIKQYDYYKVITIAVHPVNFIVDKRDRLAATNRVALAKIKSGVNVLGFSLAHDQMSFVLEATKPQLTAFIGAYIDYSYNYALRTRPEERIGHIKMRSEQIEIPIGESIEDTLRKEISNLVIQPTRDGLGVMPYDYPWSSGPLYFRGQKNIPVWWVNRDGAVNPPVQYKDLSPFSRQALVLEDSVQVPDNWKITNGIILPSNYVDTNSVENIFHSHNTFRCYLARYSRTESEKAR